MGKEEKIDSNRKRGGRKKWKKGKERKKRMEERGRTEKWRKKR